MVAESGDLDSCLLTGLEQSVNHHQVTGSIKKVLFATIDQSIISLLLLKLQKKRLTNQKPKFHKLRAFTNRNTTLRKYCAIFLLAVQWFQAPPLQVFHPQTLPPYCWQPALLFSQKILQRKHIFYN